MRQKPTGTDLLDVNVWLALVVVEHAQHERAERYWYDEMPGRCAFCRVTALAFLRLLTNKAVMQGDERSLTEAYRVYQQYIALPETLFADEPANCEFELAALIDDQSGRQNFWTDAYLSAFAISGAYRLVTFDHGFRKFPGLECHFLSS